MARSYRRSRMSSRFSGRKSYRSRMQVRRRRRQNNNGSREEFITDSTGINKSITSGARVVKQKKAKYQEAFLQYGDMYEPSSVDPEIYLHTVIDRAARSLNNTPTSLSAVQNALRRNKLYQKLSRFFMSNVGDGAPDFKIHMRSINRHWNLLNADDLKTVATTMARFASYMKSYGHSQGFQDRKFTTLGSHYYAQDKKIQTRQLFEGTNPWKKVDGGDGALMNNRGNLLGGRVTIYDDNEEY